MTVVGRTDVEAEAEFDGVVEMLNEKDPPELVDGVKEKPVTEEYDVEVSDKIIVDESFVDAEDKVVDNEEEVVVFTPSFDVTDVGGDVVDDGTVVCVAKEVVAEKDK